MCPSALPLVWHGVTFNGAGSGQQLLADRHGADSLLTMTVGLFPTYTHSVSDTTCANVPYHFCGGTYSITGEYVHHLTSRFGCDSTVTLGLTVLPSSYTTLYDTVLENNLPYTYLGNLFYGPVAHHRDTLQGINGCDSVVDFSLSVLYNVGITVDSTICQSLLPFSWNGETFHSAGQRQATLTASTGADSVVTMFLYVNATYDHHTYDTICQNGSRHFGDSVYSSEGVYVHAMTTALGCDSVETLHLATIATTASTIYDTTRMGQPYHFGRILTDVAGTYRDTLTNAAGCDSVVTLFLHVLDTSFIRHDSVSWDTLYADTVVFCDGRLHWHADIAAADPYLGIVVGGDGYYYDGQVFDIAAVPFEGGQFVAWQDNGSTDNPRSFTFLEATRMQPIRALFAGSAASPSDTSSAHTKQRSLTRSDTVMLYGEWHIFNY